MGKQEESAIIAKDKKNFRCIIHDYFGGYAIYSYDEFVAHRDKEETTNGWSYELQLRDEAEGIEIWKEIDHEEE